MKHSLDEVANFRFFPLTLPAARGRELTFDAHHLLERVHDLDQFSLRRHHGVDVLVGARNLVQYTLILAAFDTFGLRTQILDRKLAPGCGAGKIL